MKARFFLSYARTDGFDACDYFHTTLTTLGHRAYRDVTNNQGGDDWNQKIRNEIRMADAFLLFVTPDAMQSANVEKEWREALRLRKRIVPLVVLNSDVPAEILARHHFRDIRKPSDLNLEPSKVVQTMETVRQEMRDQLTTLRMSAQTDVVEPEKRKYVELLLEDMEKICLISEPPVCPPEVFQTLHFLAQRLLSGLANNEDITPHLDNMIAGTYQTQVWDLQPAYEAWLETLSRALKKVRNAIPRIAVPVVLVTMTRPEADDLESGAVFGHWPSQLQQEFDSLRPRLPGGWTGRYGNAPEDWRPFGTDPVRELIRTAFSLVDVAKCRLPLEPWFVDVRTLRTNRKLLRELRSKTCLVIVDCISSRHPAIHGAFRATHLDVSSRSVVIRTLADSAFAELTGSMELLVKEWLDCEFYYRSRLDDDPACADVTAWDDFRKLLRNQIPQCLPECSIPESNRWQTMNNVGRPGQ